MFPEEWALGGGMLFVWEVVDVVGERGVFLDGPVVATDVDDDTAPGGEADGRKPTGTVSMWTSGRGWHGRPWVSCPP